MRTKTIATLLVGFCLTSAAHLFAQGFSSGSTGSLGALDVQVDTTLDMPPDGIFNYTTINVAAGKTLTFNRNALNTPVYLLATGDVTIGANVGGNAIIDASGTSASVSSAGRGGPGGFDGGFPAFQGFSDGDGQGPGGGKFIRPANTSMLQGVFANTIDLNTNIYGNTLLSPLIGGSGGAGFLANGSGGGGGGGGGAILIASSTKITLAGGNGLLSRIVARGGRAGGNVGGGWGSGGAIRLVAPIVTGAGTLDVDNNNGTGFGRTRIDAQDRFLYRSLTLTGYGTRGSQMFVFPAQIPRLDIVNVANTPIAPGTPTPVSISLPVNTSSNQVVRVQATNFTSNVPITVAVIPENGARADFQGTIDLTSGTPPFANVNVVIPVDTVCHVWVWSH